MTPQRGNPSEDGNYVAFTAHGIGMALLPRLLTWEKGCWWFHPNTAKFMPEVFYWVGPLPQLTRSEVWALPLAGQDFDL